MTPKLSLFKFFGLIVGALQLIGIAVVCASPFADGNALYKEGRFADAEQAYNRSLAEEGDAPATRFNLGKVRESLADPARAMLEWERALRLDASYQPAREALTAARMTMASKVRSQSWWQKGKPGVVDHREVWVASFGVWIVIFAGMLFFTTRRTTVATATFCVGGLIALLGAVWTYDARVEADMALVLERSVVLRAAPAKPARALDSLPAGSRLQLLDQSGGWKYGRAADGQTGWVPADSVERISP